MICGKQSAAYAAKPRVNELIVRLEPVTEGAPQHACGGARRSALHDEVFAVEEIGGVTAVERKGLEPGERGELGGGPLPPVTQYAVDAEGALASGKRIHRHGIPTSEIKVAERVCRLCAPPRICPLLAVWSGICGALPLGFRGQRLPCPAGIGFRFRLTHVDWPIQRQRDVLEHGAIQPLIALALPESGLRNSLTGFPVPGFIVILIITVVPQLTRFVPTRADELEILLVRHLELIDGKRRDIDAVSFVLVVPAEEAATTRESQCNRTGGNLDTAVSYGPSNNVEGFRFPDLLIQRQLMQHVGQCFRVHEAVLNGHVEQCAERKPVTRGKAGIGN